MDKGTEIDLENAKVMRQNFAKHYGNVAYEYNMDYVFEFEKVLIGKEDYFYSWIKNNLSMSIWMSVVYLAGIYWGTKYMKSRPAFDLRLPLALWSGFLAVFSIWGSVRMVPEFVNTIRQHGIQASLCTTTYAYGVAGFWCIFFLISKTVELGDTAFIVLRKRPLIFLHWYHHVSVMIYLWISHAEYCAPGRWFMTVNYVIHAFMYTYYTLRALQISVPQRVSMLITAMQISQMIMGNCIFVYLFYQRFAHDEPPFCQISLSNMVYGGLMYASYLVLFVRFFVKTYIFPQRSRRQQANGTKHSTNVSVTPSSGDGYNLRNVSHPYHGKSNGNGREKHE